MIKPIMKSICFLLIIISSYAVFANNKLPYHAKSILLNKVTNPASSISFTSSILKNKILLNWCTLKERNTTNFVVQRSSNNNDWENIGIVAAAGNSAVSIYYSFIDEEPVSGINYYRLVENDLKANKNYSESITANYKYVNGLLKIYPNAITSGALNISLVKNATISIYSNSGSKLMTQTLAAGQHQIDVSKFAKGNYFIKMDKQTEVFVVE